MQSIKSIQNHESHFFLVSYIIESYKDFVGQAVLTKDQTLVFMEDKEYYFDMSSNRTDLTAFQNVYILKMVEPYYGNQENMDKINSWFDNQRLIKKIEQS